MNYFNKQGNVITQEQHAKLFNDHEYRWVGSDKLATGYYVSTVWLGMAGMVFETMVFLDNDTSREMEQFRYPTEKKALAGHAEMVAKYRDPLRDSKRRLGSEEGE